MRGVGIRRVERKGGGNARWVLEQLGSPLRERRGMETTGGTRVDGERGEGRVGRERGEGRVGR